MYDGNNYEIPETSLAFWLVLPGHRDHPGLRDGAPALLIEANRACQATSADVSIGFPHRNRWRES